MAEEDQRNWLLRIPILGYILRKIKENRKEIERTLKTKKETKGETKKRSFLGIFGISSGKEFNILKLKKTKGKKWLKQRQK